MWYLLLCLLKGCMYWTLMSKSLVIDGKFINVTPSMIRFTLMNNNRVNDKFYLHTPSKVIVGVKCLFYLTLLDLLDEFQ